jgi:excisionase family DNA binding protein
VEEVVKGFMTTKQAGERVGMHRAHIRRLLESDKIKGVKTGRDWLVEVSSLDHYAANYGWYRARRRKTRKGK